MSGAEADPTTVYLTRHAESEHNRSGVISGGSGEPGLSEAGRAQAAKLATRLADSPLVAIYSSPQFRARTTAEAVALRHALVVSIDERLRELDLGDWEGQPADAIGRSIPSAPAADWAAPGGETLRDARERMRSAYQEIAGLHRGGQVLLVGHGSALCMLVGALLDLPYERAWQMSMENTALVRVDEYSSGPSLTFEAAHLGREERSGHWQRSG